MSKKIKVLALALIMIFTLVPCINTTPVKALEYITELNIDVPEIVEGEIPPTADEFTFPEHVSLDELGDPISGALYFYRIISLRGGATTSYDLHKLEQFEANGIYGVRIHLVAKDGYGFNPAFGAYTINGKNCSAWLPDESDETKLAIDALLQGDLDQEAYSITLNSGIDSVPAITYEKYFIEDFTLPTNDYVSELYNENFEHELSGWDVSIAGADSKRMEPGTSITVTGDVIATAVWKDAGTGAETVTITFDSNEGTGTMADQTVNKDSTYELPECGFTAPANKEFKAWEVNGEEKAVGDVITVSENTTVKALWKDKTEEPGPETVTITFDSNEGTGTMADQTVNKDSTYELPECGFTAPANKEFKAWEVNGEEKAVGDVITVSENTTVKALWKDKTEEPGPETVTITFDSNEGTGTMADQTVNKDGTYELPECGFTAPANKEFKAWEVNGEEKAVGDVITVSENTTVKALWKVKEDSAEKEYVTLKFVAKEGTFANGSKVLVFNDVKVGSYFIIPDGPVRQGYKFLYWKGSKYYPGERYHVKSEDHEFTAVWEEESINIWPGSSGTIGSSGLQILPINQSSSPDRTTDYSGSKVTGSANDTGTVSKLPTSVNNVPNRQDVTQLPSTGESGMDFIAGTLALALAGLLIGIRKRMR